jgi:hypothetical protein
MALDKKTLHSVATLSPQRTQPVLLTHDLMHVQTRVDRLILFHPHCQLLRRHRCQRRSQGGLNIRHCRLAAWYARDMRARTGWLAVVVPRRRSLHGLGSGGERHGTPHPTPGGILLLVSSLLFSLIAPKRCAI